MRCSLAYLVLLILMTGCAARLQPNAKTDLASINVISRDGISETISNPERLKQYQGVDFLCSQPYQKVLRIYKRNASGDIQAYVTSYHPNGQIKQFLEISNGRAYGTYQEWYEDAVLKVDAFVIGGEADITTAAEKTWLFDGLSRAWDDKGRLSAEINYEKGQLNGLSVYYHPNGMVWKRTPFEKGQANGVHEVYQEDGVLLQTTEYCTGIRHGITLRYWDAERVASEETFCNGKLITGRYYNLCGSLVSQIDDGQGFKAVFSKDAVAELQEYHCGMPEGEVKVFARDLRLARIYHIKNGLKHGEDLEYYDKLTPSGSTPPKMSVNWFEGKIQGVVKTWYDNGTLESKREISNNVKNGVATAWYRDGQLMLIEEYDHNKLIRGEYYKRGDKIPVSLIVNGKGVATLFDAEGNFVRRINYHNSVPVD